MILHDKCEAFEKIIQIKESENKKLITENKILLGVVIDIANDRSPPWDKTDYQAMAMDALKLIQQVNDKDLNI